MTSSVASRKYVNKVWRFCREWSRPLRSRRKAAASGCSAGRRTVDLVEPTSIDGARRIPKRLVVDTGPGLPIWRYHIFSPLNEASYSGYIHVLGSIRAAFL